MPFPLYILLCVLPAFPRAYLIIYADFFDSQEPGQEKSMFGHTFYDFGASGGWEYGILKMHLKCMKSVKILVFPSTPKTLTFVSTL